MSRNTATFAPALDLPSSRVAYPSDAGGAVAFLELSAAPHEAPAQSPTLAEVEFRDRLEPLLGSLAGMRVHARDDYALMPPIA